MLAVWHLDRLGRSCSLPDPMRIVRGLQQCSIDLESITEWIETGSATGKLIFHLFSALAEFECNPIQERVQG